MSEPKNKSAVHLGRLSADSRRARMGEEAFSQKMKEIRALGAQKKLSPGSVLGA
jgi:hypothetical protein